MKDNNSNIKMRDDELDKLIDYWYDSENITTPLHTFLGMTWDEYSNWVTRRYYAN